MAISRSRKEQLVSQYKELLTDNNGIVITTYSGITVKQLEALRRNIRDLGGQFYIVKNSLMELAFNDAGITLPEEILEGTTAIGFTNEDLPALAKVILDLAKDTGTMSIKAGVVEKTTFDGAQMRRIAELPPLPILQAQLLSMIQTPANRVASALASSVRQIVNVTKAYADTGSAEVVNPA
ncbi:MAG: 50S ribosomal protein L10 [Planctomycetota bacterium]